MSLAASMALECETKGSTETFSKGVSMHSKFSRSRGRGNSSNRCLCCVVLASRTLMSLRLEAKRFSWIRRSKSRLSAIVVAEDEGRNRFGMGRLINGLSPGAGGLGGIKPIGGIQGGFILFRGYRL